LTDDPAGVSVKLSDYRRATPGKSVVDGLPDDVRDQLCAAKRSGSHTVPEMVEWLQLEGFDAVTAGALRQWFERRGVRAES